MMMEHFLGMSRLTTYSNIHTFRSNSLALIGLYSRVAVCFIERIHTTTCAVPRTLGSTVLLPVSLYSYPQVIIILQNLLLARLYSQFAARPSWSLRDRQRKGTILVVFNSTARRTRRNTAEGIGTT